MTIDATKLHEVFCDCLFMGTETADTDTAILVEGITLKVGFHPDRLASHKEQVKAWVMALPHQFRKSVGGGYSFLGACNDEDGSQWGEHSNMQELFCLAVGLGLAKCLLPREVWSALPGGMPYYVIND